LKGKVLVDIGCGDGAYTRRLAPAFERVVAIDVESDRIEFFRQSNPPSNVEILEGSASELPCGKGEADIVTAIEVVEHLGPHFDEVVAEVSRVLAPAGRFAVTTPNRWWPLEQHGWVIGNIRFHGVLFPGLTWLRPLHRRLSDASAFSGRELDKKMLEHGLRMVKREYMWPPMDGHKGVGKVLKPLFAGLARIRMSWLAQTQVVSYERITD
jgi:SAM-dependent methyltransferase